MRVGFDGAVGVKYLTHKAADAQRAFSSSKDNVRVWAADIGLSAPRPSRAADFPEPDHRMPFTNRIALLHTGIL